MREIWDEEQNQAIEEARIILEENAPTREVSLDGETVANIAFILNREKEEADPNTFNAWLANRMIGKIPDDFPLGEDSKREPVILPLTNQDLSLIVGATIKQFAGGLNTNEHDVAYSQLTMAQKLCKTFSKAGGIVPDETKRIDAALKFGSVHTKHQ